jgi:hypothetical protein
MKGTEYIASLQISVAVREVCGKCEGKILEDKILAYRHIT